MTIELAVDLDKLEEWVKMLVKQANAVPLLLLYIAQQQAQLAGLIEQRDMALRKSTIDTDLRRAVSELFDARETIRELERHVAQQAAIIRNLHAHIDELLLHKVRVESVVEAARVVVSAMSGAYGGGTIDELASVLAEYDAVIASDCAIESWERCSATSRDARTGRSTRMAPPLTEHS